MSLSSSFIPVGFEEVITFFCERFTRLNFRKYADSTGAIFVGRTDLTIKDNEQSVAALRTEDGWLGFDRDLLNSVVHLEIEGDAMLSIVCEGFSWQVGKDEVRKVL